MGERKEREKGEGGTKMSELSSEGLLGEGKPRSWAREFGVEGRVCQAHLAALRDQGMPENKHGSLVQPSTFLEDSPPTGGSLDWKDVG